MTKTMALAAILTAFGVSACWRKPAPEAPQSAFVGSSAHAHNHDKTQLARPAPAASAASR